MNPDFLESLTKNFLKNLKTLRLVDLSELLARFDTGERTEFYSRMASFMDRKDANLSIFIEYPEFLVEKRKYELKENQAIMKMIRQLKQKKIVMDFNPLFTVNTHTAISDAINQIGSCIT